MPRGVNQIDPVGPFVIAVIHLNRVTLDGDAPLTLQIHGIKQLRFLLANSHR